MAFARRKAYKRTGEIRSVESNIIEMMMMMMMMNYECRRFGSVRLPTFITSLLLPVTGILGAGDSKDAAASTSNNSNINKRSSVGVRLLLICLALLAAVAFSVFLYQVWQKKKRADQHARLLKLFEDDDELEVELGIRD